MSATISTLVLREKMCARPFVTMFHSLVPTATLANGQPIRQVNTPVKQTLIRRLRIADKSTHQRRAGSMHANKRVMQSTPQRALRSTPQNLRVQLLALGQTIQNASEQSSIRESATLLTRRAATAPQVLITPAAARRPALANSHPAKMHVSFSLAIPRINVTQSIVPYFLTKIFKPCAIRRLLIQAHPLRAFLIAQMINAITSTLVQSAPL